ncbi:cupin [Actinomadura sp. KC216]|uniref:JmjC domain-containing protein n=1 Tax=Actinomadura sp. KC216 TaxID=2530370 RepID=UPI0010450D88|nr:cupin domain-containing protein [Actinomadura sp. KC216]TDB91001.1 cupin [Actinomadura sp. KC216]
MEHLIVSAMEQALGWSGPDRVGTDFVRGQLPGTGVSARLLTPTKLLDLATRRSLTTPQLRCFQSGRELHPFQYCTDEIGRRGQSIRMVDTIKLDAILREGCTLVLDEIDVFDPVLEVFCRALQWWSHEIVQINAYLTTQEAAGFDMHWDDHDVIIFQVAGEKSWEVRAPSRNAPMYRDAVTSTEPSQDVVWSGVLKAGEVMHIPRGHWHRATREGMGEGFSLHATVGFVKRTGVTWMSWLADQSRAEDLFRTDLDRWAVPEAWAAQQAELLAAVAKLAAEHTPADSLHARETQRPPARQIPAFDLFGEPHGAVCVTQFEPSTEQHGDTIAVLAAGKKLTFKARAANALESLLSGAPVQFTDADTRTVAAALVKEGICAPMTEELSLGYTGLVTCA